MSIPDSIKYFDLFKSEKLDSVRFLIFEIEGKEKEFEELLNRYREVLAKAVSKAPRVIEISELRKLRVKKNDERELPNISFFLGRKLGEPYCILYVWNAPFLEDRMPQYAIVIRDRELIRRLEGIFHTDWSNGKIVPLQDLLK